MESLSFSVRTLTELQDKATLAQAVAAKAAARKKIKRTRTSAAAQAARDDSVYDTLPRHMVRRLKAMEVATATTAFGSSGGRYDRGVLGVSTETLSQVDLGPGMYSNADKESIGAKLQAFSMESAQRAQSAKLRAPSSVSKHEYVPVGGIGFETSSPGVGAYTLPALAPVGYAVRWNSQPRWGRGSLGYIDKTNRYKLSSNAGASRSHDWILPNKAPFSQVELDGRNPMFQPRRENRNIPYASARNICAPTFWDYPSPVNPKAGIAEEIGRRDVYKSARLSRNGGKRSIGKLKSAADSAGLGPGTYGVPLDKRLSGAFKVQHVKPKEAKKGHWLTHTSGDWTLRY